MAAGRRLNVSYLSLSMKLAKVSMINTEQLSSFTTSQTSHYLFRVRGEVSRALCMQVRREKFREMPNGYIQVLSFAHVCPDT